ncbi:type 1 glutamine amidotransferase [Williamsia sp. CHRR-6]|uniref:type 1 glutamine amidotransferase n=1 Tax=Williamsia sp. CHRR-6 TaxID=2835871 RepID=UPI001BDB0960|nr:type 1 glutamine amidotransferase [Williamsia sp. CHRR-6]MBT0565853.1 type 1 glutamine amidotransferase [Williamsia sp. CHRR-6]
MQTVLFLAHEPSVERGRDEAGTLADAAADLGYDVAIGLVGSDALLPDPSSVDAVVVLGSLESAYDDTLRWLGTEIDYLRTTLAAGTPTLGVCFGGQLLSRILGGVVARSPRPEVGFVSIDAEQPGVIESGPWMQWHFDHFTLPPGARRLAYNTAGEQAFALGRAVGLQFHPEISTAAFANWRLSATV